MDSSTSSGLAAGAREAFERIDFDGTTMHLDGGTVGGFQAGDFQIVDPQIGGTRGAVAVYLADATWALPKGVHLAPGAGVLFVMTDTGRTHTLIARGGRMRELQGPTEYENRVRRERFNRP